MNKPQNSIDLLNPSDPMAVSLENKRLAPLMGLKKKLRNLGVLAQNELDSHGSEFDYAGSYVTHIYVGKELSENKSVTFIHDHSFAKPISEKLIEFAFKDMALHLMQVIFNRKKPATLDKRDKRAITHNEGEVK